ncbi:MAG: efflux RND transporter periplasmic adaptor subunit [Acidobacteria bacterium]|nr:efflux RND transporter periplasmic adaptor subunit [Acidobacteriota bacterium]
MSNEKSLLKQWIIQAGTRRRRAAFIIVLILGFIAAAWGWRALRPDLPPGTVHEEESESADPDVLTLDPAVLRTLGLAFEPAEMRTVAETVQATGGVGPNETRVGHIRSLARGRIEKVYVRLGDRVQARQPLLAYDNIELGELIGQYLSAVAMLEKVNAEAEVAKRSLERAQNLVELGAVARADYERRSAEYRNALASINSQKAGVAQVEEKIHRFGLTDPDLEKLNARTHEQFHREASHSILRAPFDGTVIKYDVAEGEVVEIARELFTIADLSTVWVQADVYEKDIAAIRRGQEASILINAYPGETFIGRITYVSDALDPKTRTAKVRCEVPNGHGRLKLEMFATIQIPIAKSQQAVMIPRTAVQEIDDKPAVFVKTGDTAFEKREVELGAPSNGWIEVIRGVKAGEPVVTDGVFVLKSELKKKEFGQHEH